MATAPEALTDSYRIGQGQIAARAASLALVAFDNLLDAGNLDRTFPTYASAMLPILNGQRRQAATLAAAYYAEHRIAAGVTGQEPAPVVPGVLNLAQVTASLLFTGPITLKQQLALGNSLLTALAVARTFTVGAAFRHTANAGRGTIFNTAQRDRRALGYARVTDGKPCYFCAMLASRGAVYKGDESDGGRGDAHRYHDGCNCTVQAIYSHDDPIPGDGDKFAELWAKSTGDVTGKDKAREFRRAYEATL